LSRADVAPGLRRLQLSLAKGKQFDIAKKNPRNIGVLQLWSVPSRLGHGKYDLRTAMLLLYLDPTGIEDENVVYTGKQDFTCQPYTPESVK
jgi:hypothetical protein